MPSSTSHHGYREAHERWRVFALWTGLLAGPLVWLTLLEWNYVLSYVACETRQTWFLHLAVIASVAIVGAAGFWAWSAGHGRIDRGHVGALQLQGGVVDAVDADEHAGGGA